MKGPRGGFSSITLHMIPIQTTRDSYVPGREGRGQKLVGRDTKVSLQTWYSDCPFSWVGQCLSSNLNRYASALQKKKCNSPHKTSTKLQLASLISLILAPPFPIREPHCELWMTSLKEMVSGAFASSGVAGDGLLTSSVFSEVYSNSLQCKVVIFWHSTTYSLTSWAACNVFCGEEERKY